MSAQLLLDHLPRIAGAPGSIVQIRRLVFGLAIGGRLAPQDPDDEPVDELIRRIQLDKSARNLRSTPLLPPDVADPSTSLPPTWRWIRLGDAVINRDGERVPVSREQRTTRAKTYAYYGASGVIDMIDGYLFDKPLLLVGEDGANLLNRSTPIAFIARGRYWVNNHAHVLEAISEGLLRYLELYINAIDLRPYVTGTAQPKMNQARMNSIPIALPPEPEQHRIVSRFDELMALCDEFEAAQTERERRRDRLRTTSLRCLVAPDESKENARFFLLNSSRMITAPQHVAGVRKMVFELALTGRLATEDPSDEDAGRLLEIAAAAKARVIDHRQRNPAGRSPATVSNYALPDLPKSWRWARLDEVADVVGGITKDSRKQGASGLVEVPYLRVANVQRGYIDLTSIATIRAPSDTVDYLRLRAGDVLFNEGGDRDKLGRGWVWEGQIDPCIYQNHVFRARLFAPIINPRLISWHGNTFGQQWFIEGGKQTTNLASLNKTTLRAFPIPIPPLAEQHRIVAKVNELMAVCDELEQSLISEQTQRGRLLEALLHDALVGDATQVRP